MRATQRTVLLIGMAVGVVYGLVTFAVMRKIDALPFSAFLIVVPSVMGALPMLFADDDQVRAYRNALFIPWITILSFCWLMFAVFQEGALCLLVIALPFIVLAMVGTLIAWIVTALLIRSKKKRIAAGAALMALPFVVLAFEKPALLREETRMASSSVVVESPITTVWEHLAEVETIRESEYHPSLFNRLGVPRPIRATVDRAALGGHRVGEFEHGLRFQELITVFDVPRRMSFSVDVDAKLLREGSAERHAFETGYFRFIDATYDLEPLGAERTRLTLSSRYVLRSGVNWYARLWADALVNDFQERVLEVLKPRCEPKQVAGR